MTGLLLKTLGRDRFESQLQPIRYLSLLVDDGHRILQLDVVKQARQEYVGHTD